MTDLSALSISQAHEKLVNKEVSSVELTKACLSQIKARNEELNVFVTVTEEDALKTAEAVDKDIAAGKEIRPLTGIPCSLKDVFCTQGVKTTASSNILREYVPPFEGPVVERLRNQQVVFVGKTNTDEFTCGASTESSCFGVTKNPVNSDYVAGGSSGGSAAAVAAGMSLFSMGTDTGGSVRQPASFCGTVGLKVTYGRIPRSGVISMASSWDTIGPLTKTVEDAAHVLQAIAGPSDMDSTTPQREVPQYLDLLKTPVKGMKIGVPSEFFVEGMDIEVEQSIRDALNVLKDAGAEIVDVSLPTVKYAVAIYYILTPSEVSANMSRYDGIRYGSVPSQLAHDLEEHYLTVRSNGFGPEMKRRIMMGTYALSSGYYDAFYNKAQKVRTLIIDDFNRVFNEVDVIVGAVSPVPAFVIGERVDDPLSMYLADILTIPASAAGIPGLSVPCGTTQKGLPIGLQIMAPQFEEGKMLAIGHQYEQLVS